MKLRYVAYWYNETVIPEKYQACIDATRKIVPLEIEYRTMDADVYARHRPEQSNYDRVQLMINEYDVCYMDTDIVLHRSFDDLDAGIWVDWRCGSMHHALIVSVGDNRQLVHDMYDKKIKQGFHKNMRFCKLFSRCPIIKRIPDEWFTHYFYTTNRKVPYEAQA